MSRGVATGAVVVVAAATTLLSVGPASAQDCGSGALEWHEAYEIGRRELRRGRPQVAVACFQISIQKRPAPGRNLLIYGTNVLDEYYPYVNLARAQLLSGQIERARAALERSRESGAEPEPLREEVEREIDEAVSVLEAAASTPTPEPTPEPTPPPTPEPTPTPTPAPTAATPTPTPEPTPAPERARVARAAPTRPEPTPSPEEAADGAPPRATLELVSRPAGAAVFVDGRRIGRTDSETGAFQSEVASGRHELRLSLEGHEDIVRLLHFDPGERLRLPEERLAEIAAPEPTPAPTPEPEPAWEPSVTEVVAVAAAFLLGLALVAWAWRRALAPVPPSSPGTPSGSGAPTLARDTPTPSGELPQQFGEYTLVSRLGRGGMATVYAAERRGERVALKRPRVSFVEDPQFIERFLREAELGRALNHPNIVRIFDRGDCAGVPYFTMELLRGRTLREELRERGSFAPVEASQAVVQVAEALDYAHSKGVVHRDLKPSNIWLGGKGRVKVMDFGIARARRFDGMTATGAFLGTPEYISPEVVEGETADARSDLYALGVVFYELVTGRRPFVGSSAFVVFRKHATEPATPPSALVAGIPGEVERIIQRLLEKDPTRRFDTAEALVVELRDFLNRGD